MSEGLVKRLRGGIGNTAVVTIAGCMHSTDCLEAADRIEELEAKLAKAVGALEKMNVGEGWAAQIARAALAEINGGGDT